MAYLVTTLGLKSEAELGMILPHEHIFANFQTGADHQANADDVVAAMLPEVERAKAAGVTALADATAVGGARRADILKAVSEAADFPILAATGIFKEPFKADWVRERGEDRLVDWMMAELENGIEDTGGRAGWIKLSAGDDGLTDAEQILLRAAARAGRATGAAIGSHTVTGRVARQQLDVIEMAGYTADRFIWIHTKLKYRFNWALPVVLSPHDPNILYVAGNVVFRTKNEGQRWEVISPDLTRADVTKMMPSGGPVTRVDSSADQYGNISSMAESPFERGVIWVGTNDGLVQVTRDDGQTWQNVTPPGFPEWCLSQVEPSCHAAGTAYVAASNHYLDDYTPYIFKTVDYGRPGRGLTRASRRDILSVSCAKTRPAPACCTPGQRQASISRSTMARAGNHSKRTCPSHRFTTSRSKMPTWWWRRTGAACGFSMTSRRCDS